MINWLEGEMIFDAAHLLKFDRRGETKQGSYSLQLTPLSDEKFKEQVPF
jgi:hypothetical protein